MKRLISVLGMLALAACATHSPPAGAATVTVTWENPTLNVDGTPIPDAGLESLQYVRIEYGSCINGTQFGTKAGEFIRTRAAGQPMLTTATNNVPPGLTCIRAFVQNMAGNESPPSNVASHAVPAATPRAPTNVTAT